MSGTAKNAPRHLNTYEQEPAAKLLATILRHVVESFPRNPLAPEFREGNTLGPNNRHWFRAKVHEILPLFFSFFTKRTASRHHLLRATPTSLHLLRSLVRAMSTKEQVEAAKERMDAAHRALLEYVTRPPSAPVDDELHKRLGHEFKQAHHEYGRLVGELD